MKPLKRSSYARFSGLLFVSADDLFPCGRRHGNGIFRVVEQDVLCIRCAQFAVEIDICGAECRIAEAARIACHQLCICSEGELRINDIDCTAAVGIAAQGRRGLRLRCGRDGGRFGDGSCRDRADMNDAVLRIEFCIAEICVEGGFLIERDAD